MVKKRLVSILCAVAVVSGLLAGCTPSGDIIKNTTTMKPLPTTMVSGDVLKKTSGAVGVTTNPIVKENNLPGSTLWKIKKPANGRIQGYASSDSVDHGQRIDFLVSTQHKGDPYNIRVFRLGWYHGAGGRLMLKTSTLSGQAQGWWNAKTGRHRLPAPNSQGLLSLNWAPSYELSVPNSWVSGYYVALLTDKAGYQSYIPFVVRDDNNPHAILLESPVNTAQAYNTWGDWSFYWHYDSKTRRLKEFAGNNAEAVSFNRPYSEDNGAGTFFLEDPTVYWLESQGYDVGYTTSVAMDEQTAKWIPKVLLSVGHDEYWTLNMRSYVDNLLYRGSSMAFLGGNDLYWKVRYADNHKTLIGYRWEPNSDPLKGTPNEAGAWRLLGDSESNVMGEQYYGQAINTKWEISDPTLWVFKGLHVYQGEKVAGIMGWEMDSTPQVGKKMPGLIYVAKSPYKDSVHKTWTNAETTLYQLKSGAYVFDAGTIWWGYGLSNPVGYKMIDGHANKRKDTTPPSPIIQGVTENLLNRMLTTKAKKMNATEIAQEKLNTF